MGSGIADSDMQVADIMLVWSRAVLVGSMSEAPMGPCWRKSELHYSQRLNSTAWPKTVCNTIRNNVQNVPGQ